MSETHAVGFRSTSTFETSKNKFDQKTVLDQSVQVFINLYHRVTSTMAERTSLGWCLPYKHKCFKIGLFIMTVICVIIIITI